MAVTRRVLLTIMMVGLLVSCSVTATAAVTVDLVRPAGRADLEVRVLYRPDRGNC